MSHHARIATALTLALFARAALAAAQEQEEIFLAESPALSPDGARLAFAWRGDVWTVATRGGAARPLTLHPASDENPRWSPDGTRIAFDSDREGTRQLYVVDADGGPPRRVTRHTAGYRLADWFPDGSALLALSARDHWWNGRQSLRPYRVELSGLGEDDADAGALETLLFDAHLRDARVSPDGASVLFVREGPQWWRKGYRGSQAAQLWHTRLGSNEYTRLYPYDDAPEALAGQFGVLDPRWKPDGGFLFLSEESGAFNVWEGDLEGGAKVQRTRFVDDACVELDVARDGSVAVFRNLFDFYALRLGAAPARIPIHVDGDHLTQRTERREFEDTREAAWTKDGLEVAFVAGGDLWVMDTKLREPVRVTDTPEEESAPVFSPDGDALLFVSDAGGQSDIWSARRADEGSYWWRNESFVLTRLTDDEETEADLKWSPEGSRVAFVRGLGDLWTMAPEGTDARRVFSHWDAPQYDWSPDGRWFVYVADDDDFNADVWIRPADGTGKAVNVSRHPDDEGAPVWSPDGKLIAFTGSRGEDETDVYYVWLRLEDEELEDRDRTLEEALEAMAKVREKKKGKGKQKGAAEPGADAPGAEPAPAGGAEPGAPAQDGDADAPAEDEEPAAEEEDEGPEPVEIDFEDIHERLHRIRIADSSERGLFWSHDSKKLAFSASVDGERGTYTVEIPKELKPKKLGSDTGSNPVWIAEGDKILWVVGGVPAATTAAGKTERFGFSARKRVDLDLHFRAAFDAAWRAMGTRFYDGNLNNRDWNAIREKYRARASRAPDVPTLGVIVDLMLGELNGSHLGWSPSGFERWRPDDAWREETAHLGARFDESHRGPGLLVRDVIPDSPADRRRSRLEPGDTILTIDGVEVSLSMDLTSVLNGRLDRDLELRVRSAAGEERDVSLRPISLGQARGLLYEKWVRDTRRHVETASDGRLGYLHVRGMNFSSFQRFQEELYSAGVGRDGLVIDVRENGGGSTADHLFTALTQPVHAVTVPRGGGPGYPQDRTVYATWTKPIVVLCNQNSFSNAEIFSHGIKTMGRGQVVGVTTAGGVISTGSASVMDVGRVRMPFRGWFLVNDGEDMELNGCVPHHALWPEPGELPAGVDRQLDKAIEVLLADVAAEAARPRPALRKASER